MTRSRFSAVVALMLWTLLSACEPSGVSVSNSSGGSVRSAYPPDHLVPVDPHPTGLFARSQDWVTRLLIPSESARTPALATLIMYAAPGPMSVSVEGDVEAVMDGTRIYDEHSFRAVCRRPGLADANLPRSPPPDPEALREHVKTVSIPISAELGRDIRSIWLALLLDMRYEPTRGPIRYDTESFEFGAYGPTGERLYGQARDSWWGPTIRDALEIGRALGELCDSSADQRIVTEKSAAAKARSLAGHLRRTHNLTTACSGS